MGIINTLKEIHEDSKGVDRASGPWFNVFSWVFLAFAFGVNLWLAGYRFGQGEDGLGWLSIVFSIIILVIGGFTFYVGWHVNFLTGRINGLNLRLNDELDRLEESLGKSR